MIKATFLHKCSTNGDFPDIVKYHNFNKSGGTKSRSELVSTIITGHLPEELNLTYPDFYYTISKLIKILALAISPLVNPEY